MSSYIACLRSAGSVRSICHRLSQLSFVALSIIYLFLNAHLLGGHTGLGELTGSVCCAHTVTVQDFGKITLA